MSPEGQVPWQMIVYGEIYVIDKLINKHLPGLFNVVAISSQTAFKKGGKPGR